MWLDRLSGQSTPSGSPPPQNRRPYSPAPPRRSSLLAPQHRTGLGLGLQNGGSTTSLGLNSNASDVSLHTGASKLVNGSSLRQTHYPPPANVPDPLNVLRSILGTFEPVGREQQQQHDDGGDVANDNKFQALATEIDFRDLSLQEYVNGEGVHTGQKPRGPSGAPPNTKEDRKKYHDFHTAISDCDEVLKSVEIYLTNFQTELGTVSAEIESLQNRSVEMNAKLENRKKVENLLGPAVEDISLSPVVVRTISEGAVDEDFVRALKEVEARSAAIDSKSKEEQPSQALKDVKPILEDLTTKAVERIRDFVVGQIKALRSPNMNAQIIQQQTFLRYKELYAFLTRQHPVLAEEIGQAYINTMKWYYSSNFTRYQQALEKLHLYTVDQSDTLGAEPNAPKRNVLSTSKTTQPQHDAFSIAKRADILNTTSHTALSSYLAEESKSHHYLETPFANFNLALLDNVSAEYAVVSSLFSTHPFQTISRHVTSIFEPTFALGLALTRSLIEPTTDTLGVLLCVRLTQHFAFELQRRKVPVMDAYINGTSMLLWPRFQLIMDTQTESLKKTATSSTRGAAFALVDSTKQSTAPHAVTQRFGQFLQGILTLSAEAGDDEPVSNSLGRLRAEFEALMGKLSKGAGDAGKRQRFLGNNYSLVLTIISDTQGKPAEEQKGHFEEVMRASKGR